MAKRASRIGEFIERWEDEPFCYGSSDCCAFVAAFLREEKGINLSYEYSTAEQARALIAPHGGLEGFLTALGWEEISPNLAVTGDVGLTDTEEGPAAMVCMGWQWAAKTREGVAWLPLAQGRRAWRTPCRR